MTVSLFSSSFLVWLRMRELLEWPTSVSMDRAESESPMTVGMGEGPTTLLGFWRWNLIVHKGSQLSRWKLQIQGEGLQITTWMWTLVLTRMTEINWEEAIGRNPVGWGWWLKCRNSGRLIDVEFNNVNWLRVRSLLAVPGRSGGLRRVIGKNWSHIRLIWDLG